MGIDNYGDILTRLDILNSAHQAAKNIEHTFAENLAVFGAQQAQKVVFSLERRDKHLSVDPLFSNINLPAFYTKFFIWRFIDYTVDGAQLPLSFLCLVDNAGSLLEIIKNLELIVYETDEEKMEPEHLMVLSTALLRCCDQASDLCFESSEFRLARLCDVKIRLCKRQSHKLKQTILSYDRPRAINITRKFDNVPLVSRFLMNYFTAFSRLKKANSDREESALYALSLGELIRLSGGINRLVINLRALLIAYGVRLSTEAEKNYVSTLWSCCLDIKNARSRRYQKQSKMALPFCALCWRRVEDSNYYCQMHHPKSSSSDYYAARSALFRAIRTSKPNYSDELKNFESGTNRVQLALLLYKWTATFAVNGHHIKLMYPNIDEIAQDSWQELANCIVEYSKLKYPNAYQKIKSVMSAEYDEWKAWCLAVIASLDETEAVFWEVTNLDEWLGEKIGFGRGLTMLSLLQRFEASEVIKSLPRPRGPSKGSVPKNQKLRDDILVLVEELKSTGKRVVQADIARKLGVSRNRVNKLMKDMGLR